MGFFADNWLWRGTQSAIFYYVSCSPCLEYSHKRRRRNEAAQSEKHRAGVITTQPGQIRQPGAFQTNEGWVEEILMGPGPPKGWKRDPIAQRGIATDAPTAGTPSPHAASDVNTALPDHASLPSHVEPPIEARPGTAQIAVEPPHGNTASLGEGANTTNTSVPHDFQSSVISSSDSDSIVRSRAPRPSIERRLSTAMDNLRDTLRSTIRPETWNWIRYERDDEILSGFNQTFTRMWDKATNFNLAGQSEVDGGTDDQPEPSRQGRKRAYTDDSNRVDWHKKYYHNAAINDLHPPVVSRLPATRDDAAWMLLPPPSAAVMGGRVRPQEEPARRWPLSRIGRTPDELKRVTRSKTLGMDRSASQRSTVSESIPDLSDSLTEHTSSDDESLNHNREKRHSAPVAGWKHLSDQHAEWKYLKSRRLPPEAPLQVDEVS